MPNWPTEAGVTALGDNREAALELGRKLVDLDVASSVVVHLAQKGQDRHFVSVLRAVGRVADLVDRVVPVGTYGVWQCEFRGVKSYTRDWKLGESSPGLGLVFGVWRHPDLSHAEFDRHWRDVHAPLAVKHHVGMWDYTQCSFRRRLSGEGDYDGLAICQFASEEDLRERFLATPEDERVISEDVVKFGDPERLARVRMTEYVLR